MQHLRLDPSPHCARLVDPARGLYNTTPFLSFITGWPWLLCNNLLRAIAARGEGHLGLFLHGPSYHSLTGVLTTLEGLHGLVLAFNDGVLPRYRGLTLEDLRRASDPAAAYVTLADLSLEPGHLQSPLDPASLANLSLEPGHQQSPLDPASLANLSLEPGHLQSPRDWGVNDEDRALFLEMLQFWGGYDLDRCPKLEGEDAYYAFLERALAPPAVVAAGEGI